MFQNRRRRPLQTRAGPAGLRTCRILDHGAESFAFCLRERLGLMREVSGKRDGQFRGCLAVS